MSDDCPHGNENCTRCMYATRLERTLVERDEARAEVEKLRATLASKHGGEPLALLAELDAARAEVERLRAELDEVTRDRNSIRIALVADVEAEQRAWAKVVMKERDQHAAALEDLRERCAVEAWTYADGNKTETADAVRAVPLEEKS